MQHPANPIPETVEAVPGYPNVLKLYRIPASKYWQARAFMDGRIIKKSTKTTDKRVAIQGAKDFYNELLRKKSLHEPLTESPSFERVALALLEEDQRRVERGERSETLVTDAKYIFDKDLVPFFRKNHVRDITYQRINDYVAYLKTRGDKPVGSNTIKNHFVYLRKILKHAHKLNLIDRLPIFPPISTIDNPRAWFDADQYDKLKKAIDREIRDKVTVRYHPVTKELRYLTAFMVNSFLRPADLKFLQNKHITVAKTTKNVSYLRIMASAKTATTQVVSMPAAVGIYEDLTKMNSERGFGKPDDYVFFPHLSSRTYAMETMRRQFNHVLKKAKLKTSSAGTPRTLYSLRHTAIMFRLLNADELGLFTLAKNCRTSVEMIERFYASHLNAEMNIDKLHSMKGDVNKNSVEVEEESGSTLEPFFEEQEASLDAFFSDDGTVEKTINNPKSN